MERIKPDALACLEQETLPALMLVPLFRTVLFSLVYQIHLVSIHLSKQYRWAPSKMGLYLDLLRWE